MLRLTFISFIFLFSCSSLNTISSQQEPTPEEDMYRHYDTDSYVRYHISNDDEYLYVRLNTASNSSIVKILKTGLKVYFDVEGKKSKKISLEYPVEQKQEFSPKGGGGQANMDLETIVAQVSNEVVFTNYDKVERFSAVGDNTDISVSIEAIENSEITYTLKIPFTKIVAGGKPALESLSIGVVSGKFDMPSRPGGMPPGGMPGGGMPGGGQGGGMGMRGGGQSQQSMSAVMTPIDFWFKVDLQP